ncbi:MAG: type II toxin-antitoxin system VapC family toxin [Legionellales bacterium]|jgi:hypothetical protein
MIFDTDIFIWIERGHKKAAELLENANERKISIQTFMELLQGARNKTEQKNIREFVKQFNIHVLPFTENIGHRAAIYIEEYALSARMRSGDAIIAATAMENDLELVTGNKKHYSVIANLKTHFFKP